VRGRARRALGDIAPAEADLLGSVEAGAASGDDDLVADASIGLAGVLMFAGRTDEAFEHLGTADRLGSDRLRACAAVQRATVAFKVGRIPEALEAYDRALPTLRRLDMRVELSVTLLNRGVIRAQAGDVEDAMADLGEAGELFAASGQRYGIAQVCHGIGWAHARHGDLVRAWSTWTVPPTCSTSWATTPSRWTSTGWRCCSPPA
jgi:tetratricopeptide (TPR) repeat protein